MDYVMRRRSIVGGALEMFSLPLPLPLPLQHCDFLSIPDKQQTSRLIDIR